MVKIGKIIITEISFVQPAGHGRIGQAKGTVTIQRKRKSFHIHYLFGHWRMPYKQEWTSGLAPSEIKDIFEQLTQACQKKLESQKTQGEQAKPS